MDRRIFLKGCAASIATAGIARQPDRVRGDLGERRTYSSLPQAASIEPVVSDGRWIWRQPPEGETGYLEPRPFYYAAHIELEGQGSARQVQATTPVPVEFPEQSLDDVEIVTHGCSAKLRQLGHGAAQLFLVAPSIQKGQSIGATAKFKLTLRKEYRGFSGDAFPKVQQLPRNFPRYFLADSPGIQVRNSTVKKLAKSVALGTPHPWDKARRFHDWTMKEISPHVGRYTSVIKALRQRKGDCEERSSVFVALCRASGIPARLVWVPQHNWAEFYLVDNDGKGSWIPSHTAAYSWFGWTGAHELVLQKGDRVQVPEKKSPQRLQSDWLLWEGARPKVQFTAELEPLPPSDGADPGPGGRRKDARGRWHLTMKHPFDRYARSG